MGELKKPKQSEMCPPGSHVVHGHERTCHSGTVTWVDTHVRKNRGKIKAGLLVENIHFLYWNSQKAYPALKSISGFKDKGKEFDSAIQFWLDYWADAGLPYPRGLDPLMIKALIATAAGLMQITDQALRVLGGHANKAKWIEVRKNLIHVSKSDKLDPIVSIALGTRLLSHKFSQIPKGQEKSVSKMLERYYSAGKEGQAYAKEILGIYESSL